MGNLLPEPELFKKRVVTVMLYWKCNLRSLPLKYLTTAPVLYFYSNTSWRRIIIRFIYFIFKCCY